MPRKPKIRTPQVMKKRLPRNFYEALKMFTIASIKWDESYNKDEFVIGYEDRFDGLQEIALQKFNSKEVSVDSFIPWHRVQYFKRNDEIVWDRKHKIDKIFHPEEQQQTNSNAN
mmetsp:Transcript_11536/g.16038  ORF Transcript_11536/g.16038 Transcript_11536/m.16038 type:complete len:114 (+) Transcript_11536:365-706(+)